MRWGGLLMCVLWGGCGTPSVDEPDDAGVLAFDGGTDAGRPARDGGVDAGVGPADAGRVADAGADAGGDAGGGPERLTECAGGSIDRLTSWSAPEGVLDTASGVRWTLLVPDADAGQQVARVHFLGSDWHAALVMLTNANAAAPRSQAIVDATHTAELVVRYSATSDLWVQLRSYDSFGGPNLYAAALAATGGKVVTAHLSFDRSQTTWASLFQPPDLSYADTLAQLKAVTFVDDSENDLAFYGLRLSGYVPVCP